MGLFSVHIVADYDRRRVMGQLCIVHLRQRSFAARVCCFARRGSLFDCVSC